MSAAATGRAMVLTLVALWRRLGERLVARRTGRRLADDEAERDACDLISRHGDAAYYLARRLSREQRLGGIGDDVFPSGHWDRVRRRIADATGREITADGVRYTRPRSAPKGKGRPG